MADAPKFPVNDAEWTYDRALVAVTEGTFDLHGPTTPSGGWITFDPSLDIKKNDVWFQGPVGFAYHTFYAAKVNTEALKNWTNAVGAINAVISQVEDGNYGQMNTHTMTDLGMLVHLLEVWLRETSAEFRKYATNLSRRDSAFRGTAAFVIADRLKHYGDGLDDLHTQMTTKNGVGVPTAVANAELALHRFGQDMAAKWRPVADYLGDFPRAHIYWWLQRVDEFVNQPGMWRGGGFHTDGYYKGKLAQFPMPTGGTADLTQPATWDAMNADITNRLKTEIQGYLDRPAVDLMTRLRTVYEESAGAINALVAPVMPPTVIPQPEGGGGPPPNSGNLPPPPKSDSGDLPPPPKIDSGDLPPPPKSDSGDLPPPKGAADFGDLPPPRGAADLGYPPPGGSADRGAGGAGPGIGLGNGLGVVPPAGLATGPGGRPPSDKLPGPAANGLSPGLGALPTTGRLPGGMPQGRANGGRASDKPLSSSGLHIPELAPPPGAASGLSTSGLSGLGGGPGGPGSGLTGVGAGSGVGSGSGVGGGPAGTGAGLGLAGLSGGSPGASGAAGAPGSESGVGGVPFFPPMMGGAGAGAGEKPQERERQTWLSEDEAVWGTAVDAGSGVIGRLEDDDSADEMLATSLPGQDRLHPAVPRRRGRPAEESEERSEASTVQSVTT